ncbi:MAG: ABC transporter substrate-binding protein [Sandaracinaceae bacterium]
MSFLLAAACTCSGGGEASGPRATLTLNWFPEAEHGGFYAAEVHGLFAAQGLDVRIQAGRPDAPVVTQVATGRVSYGVADASEVLLARAQDVPVVAVAAGLQHNPRCILVRESAGIARLEELRALELAMNVREPFAQVMQRKLPLEDVTVVPYAGNIAPFLANERYAQQAYVFSEPLLAEAEGLEVRCLMTSDLGFDPYASLLVTSEDRIRDHPEEVGAMVRAVAAGWRRYVEDPSAANRAIHAANPEMSLEILARGAERIAELARAPEGAGVMSEARWRELGEAMVEADLIEVEVDVSGAFELRFLP